MRTISLILSWVGLLVRGQYTDELQLHGSGSYVFTDYVRRVADKLADMSRAPVRITYRSTTPAAGLADFQGYTPGSNGVMTDFLASGVVTAPAVLANMTARGLNPRQFMIGYRTVGVFANFPPLIHSGKFLNLTACDLARVLVGRANTWLDPELDDFPKIAALHPTVFPNTNLTKITIVVQKGNVASMNFLTTYLTRSCPQYWTIGVTGFTDYIVNEASKYVDVVAVETEQQMHDTIWVTPYSIGWADTQPPLKRGLTLFALETHKRNFATPTETAAREQIQFLYARDGANWPGADDDWSTTYFIYPINSTFWPICATIWLTVHGSDTTSQKAALTKAYVKSFYSFGVQEEITSEYYFGPLPSNIVKYFLDELEIHFPDSALGTNAFFFEDGVVTHDAEFGVSSSRGSDWFARLAKLGDELLTIKERLFSNLAIMLDGSGSSVVGLYFGQVMSMMRDRSKVPIQMGFRAAGTSIGLQEFIGADNNYKSFIDFGVGEAVLDTPTYELLNSNGNEVMQFPIVISTVGFFHSVPGIDDKTGPLNLTACLLAQIFMRRVLVWNDAKILDLNPLWKDFVYKSAGMDFRINLNYRIGGSAITYKVMQYFQMASAEKCSGIFTATPTYVARSVFPQGSAIYLMNSDSEMVSSIHGRPMSIGYMSVGYAQEKGMIPVIIDNKDGLFMDPYTSDPTSVIDMAEFPETPLGDYKGLNFIYREGPDRYPLTLVSYMWVRRDVRHVGDAGQLLKAFISVTLSDEAQGLLKDFGFFKLPPALLAFSRQAVGLLYVDAESEPFIFESDTALIGKGAGARVLSSMRSSITAYEMQQIYTAIERATEAVEFELKTIDEKLFFLEAQSYPDAMARKTATAGLAFGLFGAVLAGVNLWLLFMCLLARRRIVDSNFDSVDTEEEEEKGKAGVKGGKGGKSAYTKK